MSRSSTRLTLAATLAVGLALSAASAAHADGVPLGCEPESCGPVRIPPCTTCGDHSIGTDGGAGAPGHPIGAGDE